jgi:hypothetical protein
VASREYYYCLVCNGLRDNKPFLSAPALSEIARKQLEQGNRGPFLWGSIRTWDPGNKRFTEAYIDGLVYTVELDPEQISYSDYLYERGHPIGAQIEELRENIDGWFEELCAWIEVKTKQDLNYYHPISSTIVIGSRFVVWTEDKDATSLLNTASTIIVVKDTEVRKRVLHKVDFAKIIKHITAGNRPPSNHLLLRDARAAYRRGQERKAAIDAGAAVETALRDFAMQRNMVPKQAKPTLGTYVNDLTGMAKLPSDTKAKLVNIRNDATHHNASFNGTLVPDVIRIATQIIDSLDPLIL